MTTSPMRAGKPHPFKWTHLIISILITESIAATASLFTISQIPVWYRTLNKPSFNPPNWLFGPVWTVLYVLIAIAAYLVWQRRDDSPLYKKARNAYILQLILNFAWSAVFFGMHQVLGALVVIGLLWLSIVAIIYYFGKFNKVAAWLLVPYLLWVSFASVLNLYIYLLNR
ncbi:tryptophan-rich sensory protein [Mucilaginibacter galii]|uniref:Tryptophan-rich sensory protein n=1 Tax=Mucilaginibacter galii TaxID=2005073 RepID=A0A917J5H4_9SPHI|nr:TspO/MBR family protein [Mucilaginibacter galii]GGI49093.1 tryptophan-rich sensory protein [Mucilaginibacter galii]